MEIPVKIKEITNQKVPLFYNEEKIGDVDYSQFLDIRLQVARKKVEGVYLLYEGNKIEITSDGSVTAWPSGFFDSNEKQLYELLQLKRSKIVPSS